MRRLAFTIAMLAPAAAFAQAPLQPVTITPQEYQQVMSALMQRDPVMALLLSREQQAQQQAAMAAQKAATKAPEASKAPEPAHVAAPHAK